MNSKEKYFYKRNTNVNTIIPKKNVNAINNLKE